MSLGSSGGREALSLSEAEGQLGASASSLFESLPFFRSGRFASKSVASIERILSDWVLSKSSLLVRFLPRLMRGLLAALKGGLSGWSLAFQGRRAGRNRTVSYREF